PRSSAPVVARSVILEAGACGRGALAVLVEPGALVGIRKGFDAQADFPLGFVHADDLEIHLIAGREWRRIRTAAAPAGDFREVTKAFHALRQFHEGAESGETQNFAANRIVHVVALKESLPG